MRVLVFLAVVAAARATSPGSALEQELRDENAMLKLRLERLEQNLLDENAMLNLRLERLEQNLLGVSETTADNGQRDVIRPETPPGDVAKRDADSPSASRRLTSQATATTGTVKFSGSAFHFSQAVNVEGALNMSNLTIRAPVGFFASKTADTNNPSAGETVAFDDVHMNLGGAYDSSTSTFTAPVSGFYTFKMQYMTTGTYCVAPTISINGVGTVVTYLSGKQYAVSGLDYLAKLVQGDQVVVSESGSCTTSVGGYQAASGSSGMPYSWFTGRLISGL